MKGLDMDGKALFDMYYLDSRDRMLRDMDAAIASGSADYLCELMELREKLEEMGADELRHISSLENRYL